MGKKDKKKKGKGAEKTALKTEKKALNKLKKELASKGEDDIEKLIAASIEKDKKLAVGEELCPQPSPRSSFSFCAHPDKDELILFGGEFYNGSKTEMYNDLYFYNIKKNQWSIWHCPVKPPPRCSHQACVVAQGGGQMWVFGGEFASPTRSNFYHYKDLWVFHLTKRIWEQIKAPGAPSARSGHRMVVSRKKLVVFGGFHETIQDYKYFNDVHIFDLESYTWTKIEPTGRIPTPRSGCQTAPLTDGRILLYGGHIREKVKKDTDKGIVFKDMFYLTIDEKTKPEKWKWVQVKPTGTQPSPRSGFSFAVAPNNHAYAFGGVYDEETDEETLVGVFLNDLYLLELENKRWLPIMFHAKDVKRKRRKARDTQVATAEEDELMETLENTTISDEEPEMKTYEDGIFSVKIGPQVASTSHENAACALDNKMSSEIFQPRPRMNAGIVIKHGILYLYGGLYEEGDRQLTLSDFYALDIHKLDAWQTVIPFSSDAIEWMDSEESESSEDDADMDEEEEEESDESVEEMDTL